MNTADRMLKRILHHPAGWRNVVTAVLLAAGLAELSAPAAARNPTVPNIAATRHNLSVTGTGRVKAQSETQICVFCHTPHAASAGIVAPIWNRAVNTAQTYTRYTSASLDANNIADGFNAQPGGSSILCLSCHDGMIALGNVNVLNGLGSPSAIALNGTTNGKMPVGDYGATSGFTRLIGTDLSNDHPISITFNDLLASTDGELTRMTTTAPAQRDIVAANQADNGKILGIRGSGYKPWLPLEPTGPGRLGQIQCATCHDPHIPDEKFLRLNRYQLATPTGGAFNADNDQICLACHPKLGTAWSESAHANPLVGNETYTVAAAALRDFTGTPQVWKVACLNCHDTHTVQGSRRLLREGVNGTPNKATIGTANGAAYQQGYTSQSDNATTSAIENTCFQCHRDAGTGSDGIQNALTAVAGSTVPSIKSLFNLEFGMPIKTADQATNSKEVHNITNSNLTEDPVNLGLGNNANRHAECTDCHNPHRLRRSQTFAGKSSDPVTGDLRTHVAGVGMAGNVASGVLRGSWGVEPAFGTINYTTWPQLPSGYTVKKGDPGDAAVVPTSKAETIAAPYLTREHQLCFKCHSDWSNGPLPANFAPIDYAALNTSRRGTPLARANGMTRYTNVAAEFGSVTATDPATSNTDQGEFTNSGTACGGGNCTPRTNANGDNNHRSWHPTMFPTGRDRAERAMASSGAINVRPPFDTNIGKQTMHCSDCHGQESSWTAGVGPTAGTVQGPHGSSNPFLLRGQWTDTTSLSNVTGTPRQLCGNCHQPKVSNGSGSPTGFNPGHEPDGNMAGIPCMKCHIAVPHGWKNKAFLVNMNCVGKEAGRATDCESVGSYTSAYTSQPYYYGSKLRIGVWKRSGDWGSSDTAVAACGGDTMKDCSF